MRHAQTYDNSNGVFSGWRNSKLTKLGERQAKKIKRQLKSEKIDYAFTTSLVRAAKTLKIVLSNHKKIPVFVDDRLRERCYGKLQGKSKAKYERAHPDFHKNVRRGYKGKPPSGESIFMTQRRVMHFLKQLLKFMQINPGNVAISCHGNSMRPLRKYFEKLSIQKMVTLENPQDISMVYEVNIKQVKSLPNSRPSWVGVKLGAKVKLATDKKNILKKYY